MKIKALLLLFVVILPLNAGIKGEIDVNNAQAIFIYNFLTNVKWPEGSVGNKYTVGILGKTGTSNYLIRLTEQRKIGTKPIEVVQLSSLEEVNECQLLLIAFEKSSEISAIDQKTKGKACLIVAEKPGLTNAGAVIDFNIVGDKLRYKVSEDNARKRNLLLSSQLVQMSMK